ncbi:MAG: zinc ribbon domain-containing protein [Gemmatimonadales bacterium]
MTDLERFFHRIVLNLAATDASRLRSPIPLADIPLSIVPYRTNRRALQMDSSEEYEMVLLRLCAGEGGYLRTDPDEVRLKFEAEVRSANPDLEVIHRFENVSVVLRPERVAQTMLPASGHIEMTEEVVERDEEAAGEHLPDAEDSGESQCVFCGGSLPGRPVNFCPHCGQSQVAMVCPDCHADVEPGWRHCVNCGVSLGSR